MSSISLNQKGNGFGFNSCKYRAPFRTQAYILKWRYRFVPSNHMVCQAYFIYCNVVCVLSLLQ